MRSFNRKSWKQSNHLDKITPKGIDSYTVNVRSSIMQLLSVWLDLCFAFLPMAQNMSSECVKMRCGQS